MHCCKITTLSSTPLCYPGGLYFIEKGIKKSTVNTMLSKQGMRESNSRQKFWRLLWYHFTNPLYYLPYQYIIFFNICQYIFHAPSKPHTRDSSFLSIHFPLLPALLGYALDRLVTVSSIHYCTSTSVLSTSSSSRGLTTLRWDISSWGGLHA